MPMLKTDLSDSLATAVIFLFQNKALSSSAMSLYLPWRFS